MFSKLIGSSHILEDFLDFHGAKKNKEWVLYRELSATIRHLALACYSQKHILNRFQSYLFSTDDYGTFRQEALDTLLTLQDAIKLASPLIIKDAPRLGIEFPKQGKKSDK